MKKRPLKKRPSKRFLNVTQETFDYDERQKSVVSGNVLHCFCLSFLQFFLLFLMVVCVTLGRNRRKFSPISRRRNVRKILSRLWLS